MIVHPYHMQTFDLKARGAEEQKIALRFFVEALDFQPTPLAAKTWEFMTNKRAKESAQEVGTYQPLAWMFVGTRCFFF